MRAPLQKFDFRSSHYERPNQTWVCGHLADGRPCHRGPDAKGACRADFECSPLRRDDRWLCARSDFAGGPCESGPRPDGTCCRAVPRCRPQMSWRSRPTSLARRVAALTFGLLLILVAGNAGPAFLNPGPVTFQHAGIDDCSGCHSAFNKGPVAWVHAAFAEKSDIADSQLCLRCHDLGKNRFDPHSLSSTRLAKLLSELNTTTPGAWPMAAVTAAMVFTPPNKNNQPMACMTCHQEHRGNTANLRVMDNDRCQFCHTFQFANLSGGHPEFFDYPYKRRTRIVFDHISHLRKHFRDETMKKLAPNECSDCHSPDANGRNMLIGSFENNCAACHAGQVEGAGRASAKGFAVLNVPGLDIATLTDKGILIGGWPLDPDGEITPIMDFLLSGDDGYIAARTALQGVDLLDLQDAEPGQVAAAGQFAWAIKTLIYDIAVEGVPAVRARLEKSVGRPVTAAELADLTGRIPVDVVRAASRAWFPDLYREIARYRAAPKPASNAGNDNAKPLLGGGLLTGEPAKKEPEKAKPKGGLLGGPEKSGGLLGGPEKSGGLLGGGLLTGDKAKDAPEPDKAPVAVEAPDIHPEKLVSGEDWSAAGGWYREEFAIQYRPAGHADPTMKAWLDIAGDAVAPSARASARAAFDILSAPTSQGFCGKCHSVDDSGDGRHMVNWIGPRPVAGERQFTVFSHSAHFSLLDEEGCLTCHKPDAGAAYAVAFKDRDPKTFKSNFREIERTECGRCHTPAEAGDTCLTCHNYHIGTFRPTVASTPKMMFDPGN